MERERQNEIDRYIGRTKDREGRDRQTGIDRQRMTL